VKPGFVVAVAGVVIVVAGLGGCSKSTPNTRPTPSSTTTSASVWASSTPANTSSPSTTPSSTATSATSATATASASFVGQWHVHGATLDIAQRTATMVVSLGMGPCSLGAPHACSETDSLAVLSGDDTQLTLGVTAVSFTDNTGASAPNPSPGSSTAVGDSMQLLLQAPGLLKRMALHGFPGWEGGNPYWCGPGVSQANAQLCGA
jgi:hypothetical protein